MASSERASFTARDSKFLMVRNDREPSLKESRTGDLLFGISRYKEMLYVYGIEVEKSEESPFLTFDQLASGKIWRVNESRTRRRFSIAPGIPSVGQLNGVGCSTSSRSILGHYEEKVGWCSPQF